MNAIRYNYIMTFRGKIVGGVVVLDENGALPDGTEVVVEPVKPKQPLDEATTIGQRLIRFSGKAKNLPPDASRNHDHYLYGTPKR